MTYTIKRRKGSRLRNKRQTLHKPSGDGKGKWHSRATFWAYKRKSRRLRRIAGR